jgi:hypothetical protein
LKPQKTLLFEILDMRPTKPIHRVSKMSASAISRNQYVLESHAIETVEYVECGVQLGVGCNT